MTNTELKEALLSRKPVVLETLNNGTIEYERVSGIIYRTDCKNQITVSVELLDACKSPLHDRELQTITESVTRYRR